MIFDKLTAQLVDLPSEVKKYVSFNVDTYQYSNRHSHFGSNDSDGSEHALFGRKFPLEAHTVFFNVKYGSISNASSYANGLLVMAELFEVNEKSMKIFFKILKLIN